MIPLALFFILKIALSGTFIFFLCDVKIFRIFKTYFLKEIEALKLGVM